MQCWCLAVPTKLHREPLLLSWSTYWAEEREPRPLAVFVPCSALGIEPLPVEMWAPGSNSGSLSSLRERMRAHEKPRSDGSWWCSARMQWKSCLACRSYDHNSLWKHSCSDLYSIQLVVPLTCTYHTHTETGGQSWVEILFNSRNPELMKQLATQ